MKCAARGPSAPPSWKCDRPAVADGICHGHYRQRLRHPERPLREIGAPKVKGTGVAKTFIVDAKDARAMTAIARARDVAQSEVYREAIHAYVAHVKPP